MKVLIACEFSGVVREAFRKRGHDVMSCDLLPTEIPAGGNASHYQGDVLELLSKKRGWVWDLMIAFPPCTHLCSSGARWWPMKRPEQAAAIDFVKLLADAPIPKIAIENPVGILSTTWRKPDQIIQPWMFGHGEVKTTCLWLKNLPILQPTRIVEGREQRCWKMSGTLPVGVRARERSRTYAGIAEAMAEQWGSP